MTFWSRMWVLCCCHVDTSGFRSLIKGNKQLNQEIVASYLLIAVVSAPLSPAFVISMGFIRQFGVVLVIAVLSDARADKLQVNTWLLSHDIVLFCPQTATFFVISAFKYNAFDYNMYMQNEVYNWTKVLWCKWCLTLSILWFFTKRIQCTDWHDTPAKMFVYFKQSHAH